MFWQYVGQCLDQNRRLIAAWKLHMQYWLIHLVILTSK